MAIRTDGLTDGSLRAGSATSSPRSTGKSKDWEEKKVCCELGSTIAERAENIYNKATYLRTFVQQTSAHPMRFGCSIVSLMTGLGELYTGNFVSGTVATVCGAKELWNIFSTEPSSGLHRLLNDIHADVGMIETLEEANRESFKTVQNNLQLIEQEVRALHGQLDEVARTNAQGVKDIDEKKQEALKLNGEAKTAYQSAAEKFKAVQEKLKESGKVYDQCGQYFAKIEKIAKDENPELSLEDKIQDLIDTAHDASQTCISGKALLDTAAKDLEEALEELKRANALKDSATKTSAQAVQMGEDALRSGLEKVQYTAECEERIATSQKEMSKIQERSDQIMQLIAELKRDVQAAKEEASGKLGLPEVAIGIGAASLMGPAVGVLYGAATGVSAMYAFRNRPTISWATYKVYCWAKGIQPPIPDPMQKEELIRCRLDESSSGYWGYFVQRRPSSTVGSLQVNLENNAVMLYRFNLNDRDKIAKEDLLTLFEEMNSRVSNGTLAPKRCLSILDQLEQVKIDRGQLFPSVNGLIARTSPTYSIITFLRETCEKRIELQKKSSL